MGRTRGVELGGSDWRGRTGGVKLGGRTRGVALGRSD